MLDGWKKSIVELLKRLGVIPERFTGTVEINIAQGGLRDMSVTINHK